MGKRDKDPNKISQGGGHTIESIRFLLVGRNIRVSPVPERMIVLLVVIKLTI